MITGVLRNKIDGLWEIFWTGGLTNPLDVIEQITYLMFVRDLDEADDRRFEEQSFLGISYESVFAGTVRIGDRVEDAAILKWSHFRDLPAGEMLCSRGFFRLLSRWILTRRVHIRGIWVMRFLRFRPLRS